MAAVSDLKMPLKAAEGATAANVDSQTFTQMPEDKVVEPTSDLTSSAASTRSMGNEENTIAIRSVEDAEKGVQAALAGLTEEQIGEVAYKILLSTLGPKESSRPVLQRTPYRAAKAFREMTVGLTYEDPAVAVGQGLFDVPEARDLVAVRDMTFHSLCEHHLLPFSGIAHIAYIPNGKVLGLSKFPRLLEVFARRLQLQERLTSQFADCLVDLLQPEGLAVALEATHGCMCHRGVGATGSTRTRVLRGPGKDDPAIKEQLLEGVSFAGSLRNNRF
mmetsp:Transcript_9978/g.21945  ORF Transcript_9978/g.21945 Transcript_9978/m.21945 type:complete len:275 (+) Transcript_9978:50-874(+)|eukprot:CAMPEP_0206452662 /NCGR_PEP_ID=MMETSP0324_2-20121206/20084_1 /ASSEMBLY_ACC=CAM_ASM_000836 /TAXON_ID=2866 /ORGANISM="Crypthecodinium cohnii, Strain Seligo" /LENGTH=274 /DNA_ID=CAMNT_0053922805 /DNA_START=45 /DNA_END=869 /DNA_ORIENTATION=+